MMSGVLLREGVLRGLRACVTCVCLLCRARVFHDQ